MSKITNCITSVMISAVVVGFPYFAIYLFPRSEWVGNLIYVLVPGSCIAALFHISPHDSSFLYLSAGSSFILYSMVLYIFLNLVQKGHRHRP